MSKKVAILTCNNSKKYYTSDFLLISAFKKNNLFYEEVIWDDPHVNWNNYHAVIIRSTWDYIEKQKQEKFIETLAVIAQLNIPLYNPLEAVLWNYKKSYLNDLRKNSINTIDTLFIKRSTTPCIASVLKEIGGDMWVIKPLISAGSHKTFRITQETAQEIYESQYNVDDEVMIQPFVPEILSQGEYSFVFFDGEFSHAIKQTPSLGDFRVQYIHGGIVKKLYPELWMIKEAEYVLDKVHKITKQDIPLLYARLDFVQRKNKLYVTEMELIEPTLYLNYKKNSADLLANALNLRLNNSWSFCKVNNDYIKLHENEIINLVLEAFFQNHENTKFAFEHTDKSLQNEFINLFKEYVKDVLNQINCNQGCYFVAIDKESSKIIGISVGSPYNKQGLSPKFVDKVFKSKTRFKDLMSDWWNLMKPYEADKQDSATVNVYHQGFIAVSSEYFGRGVATSLSKFVMNEVQKMGFIAIVIETSSVGMDKTIKKLMPYMNIINIDKLKNPDTGIKLTFRIKTMDIKKTLPVIKWFKVKKMLMKK